MHRRRLGLLIVAGLLVSACGGDSSGAELDSSLGNTPTTTAETLSGGDSSTEVINAQPPGQARASVDGEEYTFDTVGPVGCDITDSEFNVGFLKGDNEVSFIAGGTASGSAWPGRIDVNVQTADGITNYFADFSGGDAGAVAVSGASGRIRVDGRCMATTARPSRPATAR